MSIERISRSEVRLGPAERELYAKEDDKGYRLPARLSPMVLLGVAVGGGVELIPVPPSHWTRQFANGGDLAKITCVCGKAPTVRAAAHPEPCECGRWFFYDSTGVYAMCKPVA